MRIVNLEIHYIVNVNLANIVNIFKYLYLSDFKSLQYRRTGQTEVS